MKNHQLQSCRSHPCLVLIFTLFLGPYLVNSAHKVGNGLQSRHTPRVILIKLLQGLFMHGTSLPKGFFNLLGSPPIMHCFLGKPTESFVSHGWSLIINPVDKVNHLCTTTKEVPLNVMAQCTQLQNYSPVRNNVSGAKSSSSFPLCLF